jgi:hypothetical protein
MAVDPLSGPDVADAGKPIPPDISTVLLQFKVHDTIYGVRTVHMAWVDPEGEAEQLLLRLWQLWHGQPTETTLDMT